MDLTKLREPFSGEDIEWRPVGGYDYLISNRGDIYSLKSKKIIEKHAKNRGYYGVRLHKQGKPSNFLVHRLVAQAFLSKSKKPQVNHIDGNKQNNYYKNLEWATSQENNKHAFDTGLNRITPQNTKSRILAIKAKMSVPLVCITTGEVFDSQSNCAKELGLHQSLINKVLSGGRNHTGGYKFEYLQKAEVF